MKAICKSIAKFLRKISKRSAWFPAHINESPKSTRQELCLHCGRPYTLPQKPSCKECRRPYNEATPLVSIRRDENAFIEIIFRHPESWRVEIIRHYPNGNNTKIYLNFCEYCFWMNPRLSHIRFGKGCSIHYVWMDEQGRTYETYEFGKDAAGK